ncbi:endonuclease V [Haloferacaceae archaeon DSL9]
MTPVHPEFVPDPSMSRAEMEASQRDLAAVAAFEDDFSFDPAAVSLAPTLSNPDDPSPIVAGVDQSFLDDRAISVVVALRDGEVIERAVAVSSLSIPYVPGLLSFREGGPIVDAFAALDCEPDLVCFDGSGRIHFRQAGLATHMGVVFDVPSIGIAKNLLCGRPRADVADRPVGWRTPILANSRVEAPEGTVIGYAYQSKQYGSGSRRVNPLYLSPGHRLSAETAVDLVERLCDGYKLPEPTRLADAYAGEVKREIDE